jgi:hypothetical protein
VRSDARAVVRQVLEEAANDTNFSDRSQAKRVNWMIARAFELGKFGIPKVPNVSERRSTSVPRDKVGD